MYAGKRSKSNKKDDAFSEDLRKKPISTNKTNKKMERKKLQRIKKQIKHQQLTKPRSIYGTRDSQWIRTEQSKIVVSPKRNKSNQESQEK